MVDVPRTRGTPATTSTSSPPSRNEPAAEPAAAIASVISATRSGPAASMTHRTSAGWRCTPSAMSSTVARGSSRSASAGPGSRWCIGGIPLNRWVPTRAPAEIATYHRTRQAISAGARVGTHLFNGMPPMHHREPGPALALLEDPRATVELIADGVHLHPALVRWVIDAAGPDRVALITDAIAAAGSAAGSFRLGGLDVEVVAGVPRVRGTSTIAGSTATMDQLFRNVMKRAGPSVDDALAAAVQMTSTTPARALGLEHVGTLGVGFDADLVVLDARLQVTHVMSKGDWQPTAPAPKNGAAAPPPVR